MWRATWKSLLAKKLRLALTAFSIVLGVGFVAGTFVLTDTINRAFDDLFAETGRSSDITVRSEAAFDPSAAGPGGVAGTTREPIPSSLLENVKSVQHVSIAVGNVSGYAQMVDPATEETIGGVGPPTLGLNWNDLTNTVLRVSQGEPPTGPEQVVVDAATARTHDLVVGDRLSIIFAKVPPREFEISGIAKFGDADNLAGATLAVFDTATAQEVLDRVAEFDDISVVAADDVSLSELRADIQSVLPTGVEAVDSAQVADEQSQALKEALGFFRIALFVFAAIALFVGSFLIFNTFSIIVAQRTRELALLRALGASRRQVTRSVVAEAVLIGVLAGVIGVAAGVAIAIGLRAMLEAFGIDLPGTSLQLQPRTVVVSILVGVVITVLAAILPARRAGGVSPIEAMREGASTPPRAATHRRLASGLAVTALGALALGFGLFGSTGQAGVLIGLGAALAFLGVAILAPLFARPVAGAIGAPIRGLSMSAKLGRENAMRNPRRTASTASALMIGLGLVAMVAILAASIKESSDVALRDAFKADFTVTTTSFLPMSQDVAATLRDLPEVAVVSQQRQGGFRVDGGTAFISGVDPATIDQVLTLGLSAGAVEALEDGDVIVLDTRLEEEGWSVGDTLPAAFAASGDADLTIGGTFTDNRTVGGEYVVSLDTYDRYFPEQLDAFVLATAAEGVSPGEAQDAMKAALEEYPNVEVQNQAEFREKQAGFVDQLLGLITALLLLSILIAVFGIVNTLGLSIYERTRELGLLRAVGMKRTQVKRMIRWESVIITTFGAALGLVIGVAFGWALQRGLEPQGITEFAIPWPQLLVYLVIGALVGVVAAIWPARRAARLNVLEAISYE
jgi:putative ABC transport system permease protein